jgi:type IV secretion system protein VirB1
MSGLSLAVILSLAADPHCGVAASGSVFQSRLAAIAIHESGGDPLVIGVNADRARGLPAAAIHPATPQEAAARAAALLVQGRSIDLGLMQINSGQLAGHGLTLEAAFDACRSMAAGADHYADDVRAVWNLAHRRYNTGSTDRGAAYAASVEQVLNRVRTQQPGLPVASAPSSMPQQPPAPPLCAPAWDAWALVQCSARQALPSTPAPADGTPSGPVPTLTLTLGDTYAAPR